MSAGASGGGALHPKIAAIILAAGRSSRFGPSNKLLQSIGGMPVVRRVAVAALASGARPVLAVTGHEAPRVVEAFAGLEVRAVFNEHHEQGLSSSLRVGLHALPQACDGALILLGDMPAIGAAELKALISAFVMEGGKGVAVPVRHGRRGNPVLWSARFFAEMAALSGDAGAKELLHRHANQVTEVEVATDAIFADIDAPADLDRLAAELNQWK
jgi:molybdenum cofactor cytidylyltransferase